MSDFDIKKTSIQLLGINGILTEEEVEKCIRVISGDDYEDNNITPAIYSGEVSSNCVYEDLNLSVTFKGIQDVSNLFFGDGVAFKFVIHNKTSHDIRVEATEITVNDFVVSNNELLCSEAAPSKKTIESFYLYSGALDDVDVSSAGDIYSLELAIKYEIEDLDIEQEGDPISVDL